MNGIYQAMEKTTLTTTRPVWAERLIYRRLIVLKKKSQTAVALDVGVEQSSISLLESGKTNISDLPPFRLVAIAKAYGYNDIFEMQEDIGIDFNIGHPPPLLYEPTVSSELTDFVIRPLEPLSAAAGAPSPIEHGKSDLYIMPTVNYRQTLRFFIADGDSMAQGADGIQHGDTLIVDTGDLNPRENEIYVIQDESGAVVVKRVQNWRGKWWLVSDNPKYPPYQLTEARVLGRVLEAEGKRKLKPN
jgi:phage repressor protein C with HTH and peptisase S24 domain